MSTQRKTLGILGGLGPMASAYFYRMITEHTKAECDQDHLDIILMSMATIPDRTDFIIGKSFTSPLPAMEKGVERLQNAGAEIIAIPCNTAHSFYPEISAFSRVPVINMVEETVYLAKKIGSCRLGVLATNGTFRSLCYQNACRANGLDCVFPDEIDRNFLMDVIYERIKKARKPDYPGIQTVVRHLAERGCDAIVLACTELSLLPKSLFYPYPVIDSLCVLAFRSILSCGGISTGVPEIYQII